MQARDVTFSVADPDQDIVGGFPDGPVTPPALTWAAPSPASGATGVASGNFVATMLHGTASVTVTPSSDKAGTWTPTSRTLTVGAPTGSFTFTPSAGGSHVASLANNAGIAAPAAVGYSAAAAPAAGFTAAPTSGTVPFSVTVTSSATGTGLAYDIDWGDGSAHSTTANPSHAYTVAGSYTITQIVTDSFGRTASTTRSITASAPSSSITIVETAATYSTLAAAIAAAISGQTITVPAGTTLAEWGLNVGAKTLTIRSATASSPFTIDASSVSSGGGGSIISVNGGSLTLTDARLTGNKFEYSYNAGITTLGSSGSVTLTRVEIDECSNGILHGDGDTTTVWTLIDSKFHDNGDWNGLSHNIYIGKSPSVTMRGCWSYYSKMRQDYPVGEQWRESWGHLVKSRSKVLIIEACRLTMETYSTVGGANRCIDYPCGGDLTVVGNLIEYRTRQNSGVGQAISWGVEGANRISGTTFDDRQFKIKIRQNTIVARSPEVIGDSNRTWLWVGVGIVSEAGWPNDAPTPAPTEFSVIDNVFAGWDGTDPRVIEGGSAITSTTYATSTMDNTVGALSLLTDAANYDYTPITPVVGSQAWATYGYSHPAGTVARGDSYRGAVNTGWAAGSVTGGSYNSSTFAWTPEKDGAGVVKALSWAETPTLTIFEAVGTRLDALQSQVPYWNDPGTDDWNGVTSNWNGMAVDLRPGNERAFLMASGGHAGSANDGIYTLNMRKMGWSIQRPPSDPANWAASYFARIASGNSATLYPPANDYYTANPTNAEGVDYDEFYDPAFPTDPLRSPRTPTARHTYGSVVFVPDLGVSGKLIMACRRQWEYDLATNTYLLPRNCAGGGQTSESMQAWWDRFTRRYYVCASNGSSGPETRSYWYHPESGVTGTDGYFPAGGYSASYCATTLHQDKLYSVLYHLNTPPYQEVNKPKRLIMTDLATQVTTSVDITLGASFAGKTFAANNADSPQVCTYIPSEGKLLVLTSTIEDGFRLCWLDPVTGVLELTSFAGLPFTPIEVENKFRFIPGLNAIAWVHMADHNVRFLRFP